MCIGLSQQSKSFNWNICECFLHQLANSNTEVVLAVKVSFSSVPAERMQIVGSLAEFFMQIGHAGRVASLYSKGIVSLVLGPDEEAPFWKSDAW